MAAKKGAATILPEVHVDEGASIEDVIAKLRNEITSECTKLLDEMRGLDRTYGGKGAFHLKTWESRITRINEAKSATFSIEELEQLKQECRGVSEQLQGFRK